MQGYFVQPAAPVTLETIQLVFSAFGDVLKIATFDKDGGMQALVQYADLNIAIQVRTHLLCSARHRSQLHAHVFCAPGLICL